MERGRTLDLGMQLELGRAEFVDDLIEVWVDIVNISEDMYPRIIQTMEAECSPAN